MEERMLNDVERAEEENQLDSNKTIIEEPLSGGKIAGRWCSVNCLAVHAKTWTSTDSTSEEDCAGQINIKELRWDADKQCDIYRKLYNETHAIFMQLQDLPKDDGSLMKPTRLKISRQYRSVLQAYGIELHRKVGNGDNDDQDMKDQLELLTIMEMFWHLCEIILIDTKPGGYCINQLLEWIRWHFTQVDRFTEQILLSEEPHSHSQFWPAIFGYVLQGRLKEAVKLLEHHPDRAEATYNAFRSLEDLMESMPEFQNFTGQSVQDFSMKWHAWQSECQLRLGSGEFSKYPPLENICEIFSGSESALEEHSDLCQSWYQLMVAKLLYTDPTVKSFDLHTHALSAIQAMGNYGELSPLDEIVLAILNFDVHKVIRKCSENLPNWWFVAHLTDLLFHCGMLKEHDLGYGIRLREFLLLEYCQSLMSNNSLWQIAADYLISCPTHGRAHLKEYIDHLPLENDKKAAKVLRLSERHSLTEQANSICKVMAMRGMKNGKLGSSLTWCLRSKDAVFANLLAERIFNVYMETGMLSDLDIIDNLGSAMLLSDKLTFLGKYREFHKLYNDERFEEAGKLLLQLLSSSLAPKRFWMTLLVDALPMLENSKIIFNSAQTYEIMHCLQELQLSINSKQYLDVSIDKRNQKTQGETDQDKDKLALLRLGLSRNLARAVLQEKGSQQIH